MAILRSDPPATRAELAARIVQHQQMELAQDRLVRDRSRLMSAGQMRDGVLWLTGAPKPFEAAPVPAEEETPSTGSRTSVVRKRQGYGLKLTGKGCDAYRFEDLLGSKGRLNRFKGMIGT